MQTTKFSVVGTVKNFGLRCWLSLLVFSLFQVIPRNLWASFQLEGVPEATIIPIMIMPLADEKKTEVKQKEFVPKEPNFGLLVVHCKEDNTSYFEEVPEDWLFDVYETCGEISSKKHSVPFDNNKQSEECSAYFDFIVKRYHELPEIVFFLQADGLDGYGKAKRNYAGHSPFRTVQSMHETTLDIIWKQNLTRFLHYGPRWPYKQFGTFIANPKLGGMREPFLRLWTQHLKFPLDNTTRTETRPMATFAVHRDRILARPRDFYSNIRDEILGASHNAQFWCFCLENTWHVLFGEPWILPQNSTVDHLPRIQFSH